MKNYCRALMVAGALMANCVFANEVEEVIVTSSFIDQTLSEVENPIHVVGGDDVSSVATQSLGELLDNLSGVSSVDYGSAVGQPVIRGMSGSRVKILNNGMVVRDVSGLGADHINDVDLNNIRQIEVVRGPSSLLYSNGTIGGIINVVDNTIARRDFSEPEVRLGLERQSVNDGKIHNFSYQNNIGGLNFSLAYKDSQFGDFGIPDGAVLHNEGEDEDGGHDDEEDHEEDLGHLPDSDHESDSGRFGVSKAGDWGYFGFSFNKIESFYGIPFHGEEHEEEHDGQGDGGGEEHEAERIFSTTDSDVFNLEGSYIFGGGWLQKLDYYLRDSDYSLTEQHAEGEEENEGGGHEDEHHEEGPTRFKNEAREYAAILDLANGRFLQKVVLNFVEEEISIVGAEAYLNPAKNREATLGYYLDGDLGLFHLDFGLRHDRISRKGSVSSGGQDGKTEYFDRDIDNTSFAVSIGRDVGGLLDANLSFAVVKRAPSAVELFINGPHFATGRFEVGDAGLDSEKSNNIDVSFTYENNGFFGVLSLFKNDVDNYVYLLDETEEEHGEHGGEGQDEHGGEEPHEGLVLAEYMQQEAQLDGYEFEFGRVFEFEGGDLSLSFGRDSVSGKLRDGNNIPRIVPARNIYSISYSGNGLEVKLDWKDVEKQGDVGLNETPTSGHQMLDFKLKKTLGFNAGGEASISVFANNLLDEVARNHASFVKDQVPLPGRNFGIKLNVTF